MMKLQFSKVALAGGILLFAMSASALAANFNIPTGELKTALDVYMKQAGVTLMYPEDEMNGVQSKGARGDLSSDAALERLLRGTGFVIHHTQSGVIAVVRGDAQAYDPGMMNVAAASIPTVSSAALETVTVTSSKIGGDIQNVPIAITAMSQEQLTATQTAGGPDLVRQVPNLNFTKTNFTGYDISIRGIGTEAISVTTDPAVAVAFNDTPFIRNHFFEQEFFDVGQVEVLRGPQGTLYGRNATAGVVNVVSAKPTDTFEAAISADVGNFGSYRTEGMVNIPVADWVSVRVAGEWTKRDGYTFDETTNERVDGRNLWSGRFSLGLNPSENVHVNLVWEHFNENDDRERSSKQLCKRDDGPSSLTATLPDGSSITEPTVFSRGGTGTVDLQDQLSQGCLPASLYSPESYETPNGQALPIVIAVDQGNSFSSLAVVDDPYASVVQSPNLRVIQSELRPSYKAKNDIVELNTDYGITPALTFTSQTGYNNDQLHSAEDFNRFNSAPNQFFTTATDPQSSGYLYASLFTPNGILCDPQLGCSTKFVGEDLSQEKAWQLSQEFRLASNFSGPLNFSFGANYMHYETLEDYYVFLNFLTLESRFLDLNGDHTANGECGNEPMSPILSTLGGGSGLFFDCPYTDPSSITQLEKTGGGGHNYFRSINPYLLDSYAGFGEAYYQVLPDLKLTGGLRWTDDRKHFTEIPSEVLAGRYGYPTLSVVDQQWQQFTGRFVANWTPKLDFTDQTLVYGSYSRGYKAGGANPPGPNVFTQGAEATETTHPLTFLPEFVNAYEAGTKNTLFDGALTLNADVFYYDYKNYQISQIVDRTSINLNFNANVRGAELEATWEPVPGLRFNLGAGWEDSKLASGSQAVDLIDRTAGTPGWVVVKPDIFATSNCVAPTYVVAEIAADEHAQAAGGSFPTQALQELCVNAYTAMLDPVAAEFANGGSFFPYPASGFDPSTAPNGGAGFFKNLAGNQLPNAPPYTLSLGAQYTMPITPDWAGTLRGDFYLQSDSFARVENDRPYDQLTGYTNLNLTLIFTNQDGWQAMGYMKNVFNTTAITGSFLNSDDTDLTTNVFVTDPRLFGVRITKNW